MAMSVVVSWVHMYNKSWTAVRDSSLMMVVKSNSIF